MEIFNVLIKGIEVKELKISNQVNPYNVFSEVEMQELEELYNEELRNFWEDLKVNPFASVDKYPIEKYITDRFKELPKEMVNDLVQEVINQFI